MDELLEFTRMPKKMERIEGYPVSGFPSIPGTGEAHLYSIHLEQAPEDLDEIRAWLSPEEKARGDKFHFELHRNRFIAGRGALRRILSTYLGVTPESLGFEYGPYGKPVLRPIQNETRLMFNLAHSDNLGLIGVSHGAIIGVDLEKVRFLEDFDDLVGRFFSPSEAGIFLGLNPVEKPEAFFNLWTRKEAWLKATGEGIAHSLNQVEVAFLPEETAEIRRLPAGHGRVEDWSLESVSLAPGFAAAVVMESPGNNPSFSAPGRKTLTSLA
jgi:4'-phosphopantetheinyl transferase